MHFTNYLFIAAPRAARWGLHMASPSIIASGVICVQNEWASEAEIRAGERNRPALADRAPGGRLNPHVIPQRHSWNDQTAVLLMVTCGGNISPTDIPGQRARGQDFHLTAIQLRRAGFLSLFLSECFSLGGNWHLGLLAVHQGTSCGALVSSWSGWQNFKRVNVTQQYVSRCFVLYSWIVFALKYHLTSN